MTRRACANGRGDEAARGSLRFRTLGCWPVTAEPSQVNTLTDVVAEALIAGSSERRGHVGNSGPLKNQKRWAIL